MLLQVVPGSSRWEVQQHGSSSSSPVDRWGTVSSSSSSTRTAASLVCLSRTGTWEEPSNECNCFSECAEHYNALRQQQQQPDVHTRRC
jgi:hypothetical protein